MDTAVKNLFSQIIDKNPKQSKVIKISGKPPTAIRCKTALGSRPAKERRNIINIKTQMVHQASGASSTSSKKQ